MGVLRSHRVLVVLATIIQLGCALPTEQRIAALEHRILIHEIDQAVQEFDRERINKNEVQEEGGFAIPTMSDLWKETKRCFFGTLTAKEKEACPSVGEALQGFAIFGGVHLIPKIGNAISTAKGWFGEEELLLTK